MRVKPWICRSICPRRSSPYSSSFSHYVGICDSFPFITTHVQITSSINISFFLKHMKAHMTPIDAAQQYCPEHTVIWHACLPIIVRYGLRTLHIILFTTCTKVTKMAIPCEFGSTPIVDQLYDNVPTLKSIEGCHNSLRVVSPGVRR